jgi:sugar phosphate isomerase/epimerase
MDMKLGVSNLAWENSELENIIPILKINGIKYIETVLPKYINWEVLDTTNLLNYIDILYKHDLLTLSTQSIFYNSSVKHFSDPNFINHLKKVFDVSKLLNIDFVVLGAPTMRLSHISKELIFNLHLIDSYIKNTNQILLLEPNSKIYKGDYFYTVSEIVNFIEGNKFSNIKTMIDTHNIILENEDPTENYLKYKNLISHIHISEKGLDSFAPTEKHITLSNTLKQTNYNGLVIYEAKPSNNLTIDIEQFAKIYNQ